MNEVKESYQELIQEILRIGKIKDIVTSEEKLMKILTYNGDRHLIAFFYEMLNKSIEYGEVKPEDLWLIRSGWLAKATIHLKDNLVGRDLYSFEVGDKINYASLLKDTESQIAIFTQPEIVGAFAGTIPDPTHELRYCGSSFYSWNTETQVKFVEEILKQGNREVALDYLSLMTKRLERDRKYEEEEKMYHGR